MPLPPPTAPRFLKVTSDLQRVTIISAVHWWHGHYDPITRRPYRCGGEICSWCDAGRQRELRFVVGVADGSGVRWLLELRERHRAILEELEAQDGGSVGTVADVFKAGQAINSPVQVELRSRKRADEWDIALLASALGNMD